MSITPTEEERRKERKSVGDEEEETKGEGRGELQHCSTTQIQRKAHLWGGHAARSLTQN